MWEVTSTMVHVLTATSCEGSAAKSGFSSSLLPIAPRDLSSVLAAHHLLQGPDRSQSPFHGQRLFHDVSTCMLQHKLLNKPFLFIS